MGQSSRGQRSPEVEQHQTQEALKLSHVVPATDTPRRASRAYLALDALHNNGHFDRRCLVRCKRAQVFHYPHQDASDARLTPPDEKFDAQPPYRPLRTRVCAPQTYRLRSSRRRSGTAAASPSFEAPAHSSRNRRRTPRQAHSVHGRRTQRFALDNQWV
jgi:hypothetical protein